MWGEHAAARRAYFEGGVDEAWCENKSQPVGLSGAEH